MNRIVALVTFSLLVEMAGAQIAPPNADGVSMGHVHLNVRDVDAQKKFWTEQFGAIPFQKVGLDGVKLPGMLLVFQKQAPTGGSEGTLMDHFGLKVPSLAESLKKCRAVTCEVEREFKGTEGFPNAYIIGPDGVKIELQEDTALGRPSIAYHLHYISAVGDQIALQNWYAKHFSAVVKKRGEHDAADIPGMNLTFGTSKTPPSIPTKGRAIDHIGFEIKNLKAFCKKLEASGAKIDTTAAKVPGTRVMSAFLKDPAGVLIELTEGLDRI